MLYCAAVSWSDVVQVVLAVQEGLAAQAVLPAANSAAAVWFDRTPSDNRWKMYADIRFAAELLAEEVGADILMILTEVEKVAINFNKANQQDLDKMTLSEADQYCNQGQFAPGSMLPKVEAAMKFVRANPDKKAIITSLDKAMEALEGKTGTVIRFS